MGSNLFTGGSAGGRLLAMRYEEEISGQEIADRLGRPINTVYVTLTRLHRALEECVRAQLRTSDA